MRKISITLSIVLSFYFAESRAAGFVFKLQRDKAGKMISLNLPSGDTIQYLDGNKKQGASKNSINQSDNLWRVPYLKPFHSSLPLEKIKKMYEVVQANISYVDKRDSLFSHNIKINETRALSDAARKKQVSFINKIQKCAPVPHDFLMDLIKREKIRFSPDLFEPIAAMVNLKETETIYIGDLWHGALEGKNKWVPLRMIDEFDSDTKEQRKIYFGSPEVNAKKLGNPSVAWRFVFALLHETGHLLQHAGEHFNMMIETFSIPYLEKNNILMTMAQFGKPDKKFMKEFNRIKKQFFDYKRNVESGATYFAIDALAACPANL